MSEVNGFAVKEIYETTVNGRRLLAVCKVCGDDFISFRKYLPRIKSCGCAQNKKGELPKESNGFTLIKCLGFEGSYRNVLAICKVCNNKFEAKLHNIRRIKSCGCIAPGREMEPLEEIINGYKIIKDLGYCRGVGTDRRATAICKVCDKEFESAVCIMQKSMSCGCVMHGSKVSKYTQTQPQLLSIIQGMKYRCESPKCKEWKYYGKRGIKLCKEWREDRDKFVEWSLANGYKLGLQIDRIDFNAGYSPYNCRWVTTKVQGRNKSTTVLSEGLVKKIRHDSKELRLSAIEIADKYGVKRTTIAECISGRNWKE